jgi:peroxiredoxin
VAALLVGFGWNDAGHSLVSWVDDLSAGETTALALTAVLLVVAAVEGWLLVHLLSQNGRLLIRLDALEEALETGGGLPAAADAAQAAPQPVLGLPVGSPAPAFSLTGLYGETMTLDALRARGKSVLLISSDPGCGPCNALLPEIGKWQRDYAGEMTIAMISRGTVDANRAKVTEHGISNVLLQEDREVAQLYLSYGTPSAWVIQADGKIGSPLAQGRDAIRDLVARTAGAPVQPSAPQVIPAAAAPTGNGNGNAPRPAPAPAPAQAPAAQVGDLAPAVTLPDLDGNTVELSSFKGDKTLMVFWNPGCGFCKRMTEDLKAWEANPPAGAPKMLLVSTGAVEANREQGFTSTMVLDQGFSTGRQFGASGTPSAILIDADGKVASRVAVGAPGVLALANNEDPAKAAPPAPPAPKKPAIGEPAPAVKLPDLDGRQVSLAASRGTKTLVLFWNPGCGFCNRMLDDLKAWEAKPPKGAPKLLVVSTGSVEDNKAMGLRSPVLLDQGFSVGSTFGASGTPSAVLVDAKGNIASDVAVGAQSVLALAQGDKSESAKTISI